MKRRDFIASAAAATGLAGCGVFTASRTLQYRLTLTVNVEGVLHTGSTVLKSTWVDTLNVGQGARWSGKTWGDAIIVMRDGASALVGMLGRLPWYNGGFSLSYDSLDFLLSPVERRLSNEDQRFNALSSSADARPLQPTQWPLMTYIADVGNLASATLIAKEKPDGRHVIQECSLAVTKNSVNRGIEDKLPCLKQIGTYHPSPVVPVQELPPYQLFRTENFTVNGEGV